MPLFDYTDAPAPVRDAIPQAHRSVWDQLARPGNWWTGAERVAIADEVRRAADCALCAARKGAVSPTAVRGSHGGGSALPAAVVDVVHRVVTDPGRLSKSGYEGVIKVIVTDLKKLYTTDHRGANINEIPMCKNVKSVQDMDLILFDFVRISVTQSQTLLHSSSSNSSRC